MLKKTLVRSKQPAERSLLIEVLSFGRVSPRVEGCAGMALQRQMCTTHGCMSCWAMPVGKEKRWNEKELAESESERRESASEAVGEVKRERERD